MNVRKFSAKTSRDAWRLVREALGPDAVILSNRTINGMVEILALAPEDMSSLAEPVIEKPVKPNLSESTLAAFGVKRQPEHVAPAASPSFAAAQRVESDQASNLADALAASRASSNAGAHSADISEVMSELRAMRGMLESQLAEIAWSSQQKREPIKADVMRELLSAGFSASLARYLTQKLPAGEKMESGLAWVKSVLARNLNVIANENEILEKGGVYALVGPTGVGKTTTTAKLAARCVMRHGAGKLALITTDGYRIGGYEQLRIYGKILGVMVHSVKDETDLRIALDELKNKHTVLIDTVGMGQRDKMVGEQIAMLSGTDAKVKRLLCMSATSTGETLSEVVRSYQGGGLAGCIITKLDEAATVGNVLDVLIRQKLNLYYVANGQRVPEDLHVPNQHYLVDRAFKLKRETAPFQYQDDELPLIIGSAAAAMNDKGLREVTLG
ncbi:flagellar biosynthesis protein FlhF [Noviherbaspirillum denitrificans]|uniref:Flagellar biosynthesis protein FlhF n=1 Tax=Noviherbaspirillum denitrificans TaxID=1968433 RepID=A0A254TFK0_9BURK|nr:flagellar biosynthesis protein FlhF [Noviherbaspirillum denitrificans]OWW21390.1 flagellar biosynthesis protein FlhF [Noviherbaspirillum denitrificans]